MANHKHVKAGAKMMSTMRIMNASHFSADEPETSLENADGERYGRRAQPTEWKLAAVQVRTSKSRPSVSLPSQ